MGSCVSVQDGRQRDDEDGNTRSNSHYSHYSRGPQGVYPHDRQPTTRNVWVPIGTLVGPWYTRLAHEANRFFGFSFFLNCFQVRYVRWFFMTIAGVHVEADEKIFRDFSFDPLVEKVEIHIGAVKIQYAIDN